MPDKGRTPALRLGPGEGSDNRRDRFCKHIGGRAARFFADSEEHAVALGELLLRQPGLAQEALERLRRCADFRAFDFLADRRRRERQIIRDQHQPARRGPNGQRAQRNACCHHLFAEQLFEITPRAGLHPGGHFFRAQFEKELGHTDHPGNSLAQRSLFFSIHA